MAKEAEVITILKSANRAGKRRIVRGLKANNRAKTKGAFGSGPFEGKLPSLEDARRVAK